MSRPILRLMLTLAVAVAPAWVGADIYRWVDENGRVQMSDRPPPNFRGTVTRQPSGQHELNEAERAEARARAAREEARRAAEEAARSAEGSRGPIILQPTANGPAAAASQPGASAAAPTLQPEAPPGQTDCERRWAAFRASQACYAPFRNTQGGLRPGAFETCGPGVADPSQQCGPDVRR